MRWAVLYWRPGAGAEVLGFVRAKDQPAALGLAFRRWPAALYDAAYFVRPDAPGDPDDYRHVPLATPAGGET